MEGRELLKRLSEYEGSVEGLPIPEPGKRLTLLHNETGQVVGRALVTPFGSRSEASPGVITVGGMRTSEVNGMAGVFLAKSTTASLKHAMPVVPLDELARWATDQANALLKVVSRDLDLSAEIASICAAVGADISSFKVRNNNRTLWSIGEIAQLKELPDTILVVHPNILYSHKFKPGPLAFFIDTTFRAILIGPGPRGVWPPLSIAQPDGRARLARTPAGVLISAIAKSWGSDADRVLAASSFDPEDGRFKQDPRDLAFAGLADRQREQVGEQIFLIRKPTVRNGETGRTHP
jgi:hypothetical protein